jgi:antitoxin component YwqK of YwqJK toxin-antitoxin module
MAREIKFVYFLTFLLFALEGNSQFIPKKIKFRGEDLFVYPMRSNGQSSVPPTAFSLPDGKYALLSTFVFKRNPVRKKMVLKDTMKVTGVFYLKNNLPEGKAEFFEYRVKPDWSLRKKPFQHVIANYKAGVRDGECRVEDLEAKTMSLTHFKSGTEYGDYLFYKRRQLIERRKYASGAGVDTVFFWYDNGKLKEIYDLNAEYSPMPDSINAKSKFSFYEFVWNKYGFCDGLHPKTFYRTYDEKGQLLINMKAENSQVIFFDTVRTFGTLTYVTKITSVHPDSADYYTYTVKGGNYTEIHYYLGNRLFKKEILSRCGQYGSKEWKAGNKKWNVETYADLSSVNRNSLESIYTGGGLTGEEKYSYYIIPALGFEWSRHSYNRTTGTNNFPWKIDTLSAHVYTTDSAYRLSSDINQLRKILCYPVEEGRQQSALNYKKYDFLFDNLDPAMEDQRERFPFPHERYVEEISDDFYGIVLEKEFYNKEGKLNGEYLWKDYDINGLPKKLKNAPIIYNTPLFGNLGKGNFVNGKMEGTWVFLSRWRRSDMGKDLKKMYTHPKVEQSTLTIVNYRNGQMNGKFEIFEKEKFRDYSESGEYRFKRVDYRKFELNFVNDTLEGIQREFRDDGSVKHLCNYRKGKLNGRNVYYTAKGDTFRLVTFSDGLMDGVYKDFRGNKVVCQAMFKKNLLHGAYSVFDFNTGNKFLEIIAERGVLKSKTQWFKSGTVKEEIVFSPASTAGFTNRICDYAAFPEYLAVPGEEENKNDLYASYKSYYENGTVLCEGQIKAGAPCGTWKFYNIQGQIINEVNFADTSIVLPGDKDSSFFIGTLTGYFNNGKKRCTGYVTEFANEYDCASQQDRVDFKLVYLNAFTYSGNEWLKNGTGKGIIYDENGLKLAEGELKDFHEQGVWKYYDRGQKLNQTGRFVNGVKDGLWYKGDLEKLNFEDNACFDPSDADAQKEFEYLKKSLEFETTLYRNGVEEIRVSFEVNENKEIEYRENKYRPRFRYKFRRKSMRPTSI